MTSFQGQATSILAGGLSGGISSKLAGGTFVDGVKNGLITAGLNHVLHSMADGLLAQDKIIYNAEIGIKDNGGDLIGHLVVSLEFTPDGKGAYKYSNNYLKITSTVANLEMSIDSVIPQTDGDLEGIEVNIALKATQFAYGSTSYENAITIKDVYTHNRVESENLVYGGGQATLTARIMIQPKSQDHWLFSQNAKLHALNGFSIASNQKHVYLMGNIKPYINSIINWPTGKPTAINGNFPY